MHRRLRCVGHQNRADTRQGCGKTARLPQSHQESDIILHYPDSHPQACGIESQHVAGHRAGQEDRGGRNQRRRLLTRTEGQCADAVQ